MKKKLEENETLTQIVNDILPPARLHQSIRQIFSRRNPAKKHFKHITRLNIANSFFITWWTTIKVGVVQSCRNCMSITERSSSLKIYSTTHTYHTRVNAKRFYLLLYSITPGTYWLWSLVMQTKSMALNEMMLDQTKCSVTQDCIHVLVTSIRKSMRAVPLNRRLCL